MKMIETVVKELYYGLSESVNHDQEYKEKDLDLKLKLEKIFKENAESSLVDAYLNDVANGKIEAPEITKNLANSHNKGTALIELENAIDNRQLQAIEITCREAFLYGISYCNQIRGMNVQNLITEKEMLFE